jgi:hypothetical protein
MTTPTRDRTPDQIRADLEAEREQLAEAVEHLRDSIGSAADIGGKLKEKLPVAAAGAATVGFVLAGGIGATMRYFSRRGRESKERARIGRFSIRDRG